ncbi:MAG: cation diffusion facilitator family transporter [Clostridiales bacterium]|jgi:cation diffusion facilitator family transporter|nr:cation diffusion facilitator family transporter [Clostridiales bacterium]
MDKRLKKMFFAAAFGLGVNLLLSGAKLSVGLAANSISIFSDAVHNFLDALSFAVVIFGFYLMRKKPSESMPFGYGRIEYILGCFLSLTVLFTGLYFMYSALERLFYPYFLVFTWERFAVIAVGALVKLAAGLFFRRQNKSLKSDLLSAAGTDSFLDAGITLMTLIGFSLHKYSALRLDAIVGIVISVIIIIEGIKLFKNNVKNLLGKKIDKTLENGLRRMASEYAAIGEVKSLTLHDYGENYKEIIFETVFTKDLNCDIIEVGRIAREIAERAEREFGVIVRLCISGL